MRDVREAAALAGLADRNLFPLLDLLEIDGVVSGDVAKALARAINAGIVRAEGVGSSGPSAHTRNERRRQRLDVGAFVHLVRQQLGRASSEQARDDAAKAYRMSPSYARKAGSEFNTLWKDQGQWEALIPSLYRAAERLAAYWEPSTWADDNRRAALADFYVSSAIAARNPS